MKSFINYDLITGEIYNFGQVDDDLIDLYRISGKGFIEEYATPDVAYVNNQQIVFYTEQQRLTKASYHPSYYLWSNEAFEWIDPRSEQDKYNEADYKAKLQRNDLLLSCDWTQLSDVVLANKQEWAVYRQELRDITTQSGYPFNINWPTKPE